MFRHLVSGELGCQCYTNNDSRNHPAQQTVETKPLPVPACQQLMEVFTSQLDTDELIMLQ
jgi:nitrogenase molybdenum-iron protein alpha/beta subunit